MKGYKILGVDWKPSKLGDCIKLQRGHDLPIAESSGGLYPICGSSGIIGYHNIKKCKGPGLVLGRSGNSMGKAHYIEKDFWPHNTVMYVTDFLGNSPKFLFYLLTQINFKSYNSGSAVPSLNRNYIQNIEVNLPPLPEQRAIASILSALDNKIELNLQTNKTLEDMAMTLYKHWFVDFGPFRDGEFVPSELGEIPIGWEVKRLMEIYINHNRKRAPISTGKRALIQGVYPYYGATKILDYINDFKFEGEYVLLAEDGTVKTERDTPFLQYVDGQFWVSNHAHVLTGNGKYSTEFLYVSLANTNVLPIITGAVQLKINKENLESLSFIVAPQNIMRSFDHLIIPIFKQIKALEKENKTLTTLRDTLLPKLISGEVRVKDAALKVAEAL